MNILKAQEHEYREVRAFYHSLIDAIDDTEGSVGWKKDIYPSSEYLRDTIAAGELYIAREDGKIVAAMVLNHECNESYREFHWPTQAEDHEVSIIHALGVHPDGGNRGIGKSMVRFAVDTARANGQKCMRLDVLRGNVYAEKLYRAMGFEYLHTLKMFYEDTGWTDFMLYELVL